MPTGTKRGLQERKCQNDTRYSHLLNLPYRDITQTLHFNKWFNLYIIRVNIIWSKSDNLK